MGQITRFAALAMLVFTMVLAGSAGGPQDGARSVLRASYGYRMAHSQRQQAGPCTPALMPSTNCQSPQSLRDAYGVTSLIKQGFTGKGQTVVIIDSFGSPTLQHDLDVFSDAYGLPRTTVDIRTPLGPVDFHNPAAAGWAGEAGLDVETVHALAPDAHIVMFASPVDETEGTIGLPEFMQLEQYAINNNLGFIFSQSWGASEATLADAKSQAFLKTFADFYQNATLVNHATFFASSGDNGATDFVDLAGKVLAKKRTVSFPNDVPWVTSVGGTSLLFGKTERAWSGSGGGVSKFYTEPAYQNGMSASVQKILGGMRGVPDIAADGDPNTGLMIFVTGDGGWEQVGGTSLSVPQWAAIAAIANQMAGHPLGFLNPRLYKLALTSAQVSKDLHDITIGNNNSPPVKGFKAVPGWDPVTGWGSPNAANLLPALINTSA